METLDSVLSDQPFWRDVPHLRVPLFAVLRGFLARDFGVPRQSSTRPALLQGTGEAGSLLAQLSFDERDALVLAAAAGFSDVEAAQICGCAPETVRRRVKHGLAHLAEHLV